MSLCMSAMSTFLPIKQCESCGLRALAAAWAGVWWRELAAPCRHVNPSLKIARVIQRFRSCCAAWCSNWLSRSTVTGTDRTTEVGLSLWDVCGLPEVPCQQVSGERCRAMRPNGVVAELVQVGQKLEDRWRHQSWTHIPYQAELLGPPANGQSGLRFWQV